MTAPRRLELTYEDQHGRMARHTLRADPSIAVDSGTMDAALDALQSLSSADLFSVEAAVLASYSDSSPATSDGVPATVYCVLFFSVPGSDPEICCSVAWPSPVSSLFLPSGFIDPDSSTLDAVVSAILDCCTSPTGAPFGELLFGYRSTNREGM